MCIKIQKEAKTIMGIALTVGIIICTPFIIVDYMLLSRNFSIQEEVCFIILEFDIFDEIIDRYLEVDLLNEVVLVAFLILMTIISCNVPKKGP